ncbi:hypothetical protein O181_024168 [Austropuccinia psidii MF-1]|uniref:DUF4939 domain-containing protein n=1 Tax=Austropuccinia psidii MF-1 TaxID=1389203 RepID=A0A9Q3CK88_9BASI|nr:hypothetical protein [Austropuccinia psidii MF-1]
MEPLGPFRPKSNEAKRGQSTSPQGQVGTPEPNFSPNLNIPKMAKKDPRTQIGQFQHMASGNHQRPPAQFQQGFPSIQGKTSPSSMYPVPKDPGMSPSPSPISKEVFSVIKSCNPWKLPEDYSRTPTTWPCRSRCNQLVSQQSKQSLLAIMQQMTQIMANVLRPPAIKTLYMTAPECFDGTQPFKVRIYIQSFQLIFHNYQANFSEDRKKALYGTSFLIGRASKWIEPYLSNLTNKDPEYLLKNLESFESQVFTLFGDPNEVIKAETELDVLRMKECGHLLLYIADFRSLAS